MRKVSGVIAVYNEKICILKASSGKGWTIPKGGVESGLSKKESAAKEAFEEAGLVGNIKGKIGEVTFVKGGVVQQVTLFAMRVSLLASDYPEKGKRRRKFVGRKEALEKLPSYYHDAVNGVKSWA